MRYATETIAIQFLFSFTFRWITFLNTFFRTPEKNHSLWFLQNFDETMTAGYFLVGGKGGIFPPRQIGSNNGVLYFPKDNTPPRPPYHRLARQYSPLQNIPRKYPIRYKITACSVCIFVTYLPNVISVVHFHFFFSPQRSVSGGFKGRR